MTDTAAAPNVPATATAVATPGFLSRLLAAFASVGHFLTGTHAIVQQVSANINAATPTLEADAKIAEDLAGHPELNVITDAAAGTEEATAAVLASGSLKAGLTNLEGALAQAQAARAALQTVAAAAGMAVVAPAPLATAAAAIPVPAAG